MSPEVPDVAALIVDLCSQVEAQMVGIRKECQMSLYEICMGVNNSFSKEMDRMVYHIRRLIDQNAFLYDRVVELEKRDDRQKAPRRNRGIQDLQKGPRRLHLGSSGDVAPIQRGGPRRQVRSLHRQAG